VLEAIATGIIVFAVLTVILVVINIIGNWGSPDVDNEMNVMFIIIFAILSVFAAILQYGLHTGV